MPLTSDALLAILAERGIASTTSEHAPVFTVAESQGHRGTIPGAHTKTLFLRDNKRRFFLVCLAEDRVVDLKALRPRIGARGGLSFASPEALLDHLGITPGSVSPLALANDTACIVTAIIDAAVLASPIINLHPLINTRTTSMAPQDLLAFLGSTGHEPMVIAFDVT